MEPGDLLKMTQAVVILKRIKVIKCKKCTKVFTKQKDYKLHKMKHDLQNIREERREKIRTFYGKKSGYKKTLQCDQCEMRFVAKSTLKAHSVLHKPFPNICGCGVGFYEKNDLESHIKLVHNKDIKNPIQKMKTSNGVQKKKKM
ncbi:zinc finger protein 425-like [Papilio machaon]|uniref:zinc finger protein 425-like n=1 Tax=Papilio machaon TaxID=76193 RepID=UPI001E664A61|nr:zinc finger protein 425-like [Papilio machaon]